MFLSKRGYKIHFLEKYKTTFSKPFREIYIYYIHEIFRKVSLEMISRSSEVILSFTPAQICMAIWSYYLYTLLIKNPKLQPNTQPQMEAPNCPASTPTYQIGSRLARQIQSLHMKRFIEPKKIFIDLFNAKIKGLYY